MGDDKLLTLAKAVLSMMIGFITSIILGLILIPLMKKIKIKQKISIFLIDKHKKKEGTPTMGGLIFILSTLITVIILILIGKLNYSYNFFIVLFVFASYGLLGFIDDYLIVQRNNNDGLTKFQKLIGQLFIAIVFFFVFMRGGHEPILNIYTLGITIPMGWFYGVFLLFVLVASSNAVNLTDGLDGLAGGLALMAFLAFGLISWNSGWVEGNMEIAIFCFILVGSLFGFLFYNTNPAKIFMGDTGSLSLGGALASVAIITDHEITLIVVAGVFVIETLSLIVQLISIKFFNKKVFLMAPLHHHFEKLGWDERDIVKIFWVFGLIFSMAAIAFGVWI